MVLPLIPIALGAASLATAFFGGKKGLDAKKSLDAAKSAEARARDQFNEVCESVEQKKMATNGGLQQLGRLRLQTDSSVMKTYVELANSVHNVSHKAIDFGALAVKGELPTFEDMKVSAYEATDLVKDGLAAVPAGVLLGYGAVGTVSSLGVASTGAAITGLSGVAATNATLAWLGGGSLAAGGWGVAGGTAVLGGVVLGPVVAVMGLAAASKMNKMATEIRAKEAEVQVATEQLRNAIVVLDGLDRRVAELSGVLIAVTKRFRPALKQMSALIEQKRQQHAELQGGADQRRAEAARRSWLVRLWRFLTFKRDDFSFADPLDFQNFTAEDKAVYSLASAFAYPLYALLKVPVLDSDGNASADSAKCVASAQALLTVE